MTDTKGRGTCENREEASDCDRSGATVTHHSHGVGGADLDGAERRVEGDVGQHVHRRHQDDGDGDGARQVPEATEVRRQTHVFIDSSKNSAS